MIIIKKGYIFIALFVIDGSGSIVVGSGSVLVRKNDPKLSCGIRYLFCSQVYQQCDSPCHRSTPQVHPLCQVQINVGWTGPSFTGILVKTRTLWERVPHVKVPDVQGVNVWLCTL